MATKSGPRTLVIIRLIGTCIALCLAGFTAESGSAQSRDCTECKLSFRLVREFGSDDGPGSLSGPPVDITTDGRGRYWVLVEGQLPQVFAPNGTFLKEIGRRGDGPGEYRRPQALLPLPGDSMLVFDSQGMRASVIGPDFTFARSVSLAGGRIWRATLLTWPSRVLINAIIMDEEHAGLSLHEVDFTGPSTRFLRSGSLSSSELRPGQESKLLHHLSLSAADGSVSVVDVVRYRVCAWREMKPTYCFNRSPSWMPRESNFYKIGSARERPDPRIWGISRDGSALYVFAHSARPDWQRAWSNTHSIPSSHAHGGTVQLPSPDDLFGTQVEKVESTTGRLLGTGFLNGVFISALRGGHIAVWVNNSSGVPRVRVYAVRQE